MERRQAGSAGDRDRRTKTCTSVRPPETGQAGGTVCTGHGPPTQSTGSIESPQPTGVWVCSVAGDCVVALAARLSQCGGSGDGGDRARRADSQRGDRSASPGTAG